jgi:hypothetical protein
MALPPAINSDGTIPQIMKPNPLMDLAARHMLVKPAVGVGKLAYRATKFAAVKTANWALNDNVLDFMRYTLKGQPFPSNKNNHFIGRDGKRFMGGRNDTPMYDNIGKLTTSIEKQTKILFALVNISKSIEKNISELNKKYFTPKQRSNTRAPRNPNFTPQVTPGGRSIIPNVIPGSKFTTNKSSGILGSILSSIMGGGINGISSALGGTALLTTGIKTLFPSLVKFAKRAMWGVLKLIPGVGTFIAAALSIPEAIEEFEKNGFGAALKDFTAGLGSNLTFNFVSKEFFAKHINDIVSPIGDFFEDIFKKIGEHVKSALTTVIHGIWSTLGKIKISADTPLGKIDFDPFKNLRELSQGMSDEQRARISVMDQGGNYPEEISDSHPANSVMNTYRNMQAGQASVNMQKIQSGQATTESITKEAEDSALTDLLKKNIQIIKPWGETEDYHVNKGDVLTSQDIKNIFGVGNDRYEGLIKALESNKSISLTDEPTSPPDWWIKRKNVTPDLKEAPNPGKVTIDPRNEKNARKIRISPTFSSFSPLEALAKADSKMSSLIEGRKLEPFFTRETGYQNSRTAGSNKPILISNAPVTNIMTGGSGEGSRSIMSVATYNKNRWEEVATAGIPTGIP